MNTEINHPFFNNTKRTEPKVVIKCLPPAEIITLEDVKLSGICATLSSMISDRFHKNNQLEEQIEFDKQVDKMIYRPYTEKIMFFMKYL